MVNYICRYQAANTEAAQFHFVHKQLNFSLSRHVPYFIASERGFCFSFMKEIICIASIFWKCFSQKEDVFSEGALIFQCYL